MTTAAPFWAHCGQGVASGDPFASCTGRNIAASGRCLAHADAAEQTAYLAALSPGADLDLRGTVIDRALLGHILSSVTDPATHRPTIGDAQFGSATFTGNARFDGATFTGDAWFNEATFTGDAWFNEATFTGDARFDAATFTGNARFVAATFTGNARFDAATFTGAARFNAATFTRAARFVAATFTDAVFVSATFTGDAVFDAATFTGDARFDAATFTRTARFDGATFTGAAVFVSATFTGNARFNEATFTGNARFDAATFTRAARFDAATFTRAARFDAATFTRAARFDAATFTRAARFDMAVFERTSRLGPLVCAETVVLSGASFRAAVTVEVAAKQVEFRRTRWAQPATVWLRYADVNLTDAIAEYPVTVAARTRRFTDALGGAVDESALGGLPSDQVRVVSMRGVDAAQLVLTDIDLSRCLFAGTVHLDQLRLEGDCRFPRVPAGLHWRGWLPVRHTRRGTLAEEQHWRSTRSRAVPGWQAPPPDTDIIQPRALAAVYRALRKAFEDSSNEPGAADIYYGEMEMRRVDPVTAPAERGLITAYWALSGYGLRATRALLWLLLAVTGTMLAMMLWGLPQKDTPSLSTGTLTGHRITMATDNPDPENPTGPPGDRLTSARFEKSLRVVVNSVIFRSSGQDLTTTGTYTEMASRLSEPVLLGLAILAIRGRIKR